MRHSDIRISSDIRIGCRIVEKNEAVTGQKRSATTGNGFSHLCHYINRNDRKWVPLYQLSWAVWGQNKTQKCVCEQVSRANKGHNRQSDIRFPTESLFSKEVDSG